MILAAKWVPFSVRLSRAHGSKRPFTAAVSLEHDQETTGWKSSLYK